MRILKAYGIVEVRPKVGATITDNRIARALELFAFDFPNISRETFADVQGFRVALEVLSVDRIFARATDADVAALRATNADLLTARSVAEAADTDFRFHLRLVSLIGNRVIGDVYGMMKPVILRIMEAHKTRRTFETGTFREHEGVVDALAAQRPHRLPVPAADPPRGELPALRGGRGRPHAQRAGKRHISWGGTTMMLKAATALALLAGTAAMALAGPEIVVGPGRRPRVLRALERGDRPTCSGRPRKAPTASPSSTASSATPGGSR